MAPRKVFVAVAGNIGAGKSSLTRLLSRRFGWKPYFESVADNPYLGDFYDDMNRWSFNLQVYFLSNRFRSHKAITEGRGSVILDRVIYEDAEIFARNLHEIGNMETARLRELRRPLQGDDRVPPPSGPADLSPCHVDTLMKQIALRGRDFEQSIQRRVPRAAQRSL